MFNFLVPYVKLQTIVYSATVALGYLVQCECHVASGRLRWASKSILAQTNSSSTARSGINVELIDSDINSSLVQ